MTTADRHLVVLGCSSTKLPSEADLPAVERYDGPMYRVLRSFLRESTWPAPLSVAVLSAQYGLIGGLAPIQNYDRRMDRQRAAELVDASTHTLQKWAQSHDRVTLVLGKDYLPALDRARLESQGISPSLVDGSIGIKLHHLRGMLHEMHKVPRVKPAVPTGQRSLYFLPDWDDMLDVDYNFEEDRFSAEKKEARGEQHCVRVMQPHRMCDGVLVSLAQHLGSKGALRKFAATDSAALAPESMRTTFALTPDQWLFGDCGAFSYVNEPNPTITTDQAVSLYQLYGFDFGASVDHIPAPEIEVNGQKVVLSPKERAQRVALTRDNAQAFIAAHKLRRCTFTPVGVIQALAPESYAAQLLEYVEMGYKHVAIGGLVPKADAEIVSTAKALAQARKQLKGEVWIHLFGVFRPQIQPQLRECGITSFDSATYFRKAWLRSDQNYLASSGQWYAAIRVPMTSDPRTRKRLAASGHSLEHLQHLERTALTALHEYAARQRSLDSTLVAIASYDMMLSRGEDHGLNLLPSYQRTLAARPWETCLCPVCQSIGIDVVVFRGANRNKRRGAHNTLMLYTAVQNGGGAQA